MKYFFDLKSKYQIISLFVVKKKWLFLLNEQKN